MDIQTQELPPSPLKDAGDKKEHGECPIHRMREAEDAVDSGMAVPAAVVQHGVHCLCPEDNTETAVDEVRSATIVPIKKRVTKKTMKRLQQDQRREQLVRKTRENLLSLSDSLGIPSEENPLATTETYKRGHAVRMLRHAMGKLAAVNQVVTNALLMFEATSDPATIAHLASCIDCLVSDHRRSDSLVVAKEPPFYSSSSSDEACCEGGEKEKKPTMRPMPDAYVINLETSEPSRLPAESSSEDEVQILSPAAAAAAVAAGNRG